MDTQTPVVTKPVEVVAPVVNIPDDKLLEALFFFWDGFDRASMNFFLTKKTADQVKADRPLEGDRLTLGIRKLEWIGGQGRVFKAFMEHEHILPKKIDEDNLLFTYKGVPVYLTLYADNPYITALDIAFYRNDTFNIPNPLADFNKLYD